MERVLAFIVIVVVMAVIAVYSTRGSKSRQNRLKRCRKKTKGYITSIDMDSYGRAKDDFFWDLSHPNIESSHPNSDVLVRYEYYVEEKKYCGIGSISYWRVNPKKTVGKQITIYYDPSHPSISCSALDKNSHGCRGVLRYIFAFFIVIALIVIVPFLIFGILSLLNII